MPYTVLSRVPNAIIKSGGFLPSKKILITVLVTHFLVLVAIPSTKDVPNLVCSFTQMVKTASETTSGTGERKYAKT